MQSPVASKALTTKTLNLCLARYHFMARSAKLLSRPFGLVVDPINNCNLACPGCVHSARAAEFRLFDWNSGMLQENCFAELLNGYGSHAIEIMLCNYGEPLLNPRTPDFIRLAKTYLMRTALSTNITARRFDADAYVNSGLDFMTVSIDGASQSVYERYRKKGDLDLAFSNIEKLINARRQTKTETPVISWQFLAFEHNAHEIDQAARIARELGCDQFVVANPFDVSWDDPSIRPARVESRTIAFRADAEKRTIANWNPFPEGLAAAAIEREFEAGWDLPLADESPAATGHTCHWLYKNMVMDATGRVLPCCAAPKPSADLVFAGFGDTASDAGAFNSEKYRLARLSFTDRGAYEAGRHSAGLTRDPYCVRCEWNQTSAHTDAAQVEQYFRTAGDNLFDAESVGVLSGW